MAIPSGGQLVCGFLSGANVHDVQAAVELVEDVVGWYVVGDRGYDSDRFRRELGSNNNIPVIPGRKNRTKPVEYDKEVYKKRGVIERVFGKLKGNRRLAVRYEKSDINFLGFILIGFLKIFLC